MNSRFTPHDRRRPGLYDAKPGMILRRIKSRAPIPEYIRHLSGLAQQQAINPMAAQQNNLLFNAISSMNHRPVGFWEGIFG